MNSLRWSPLFDSIIEIGGECNLLIAPFIQSDALKLLLKHFDSSKLQVITSWTASSLASGVSDPGAYAVLKDIGVPLYINERIHLKLFVFENDIAFHTSANITSKGLGLHPNSNVEIGCKLELHLGDWLRINDLLESSSRVTDEIFLKAREYAEDNRGSLPPLPPLVLAAETVPNPFSYQSLPQCRSPEDLWAFYSTGQSIESSRAACIHDLWLYKISCMNLSKGQFFDELGRSFREHPFVNTFTMFLKMRGTLHFGAVNAWITNNCSDRPTPTRWQVKPATNRLYNWLASMFEEISWKQPGHSQIISWGDP